MRFEITTKASPGQVLSALADFTERRPQIWSRTLDPRTYEVRAQGDTWAVARESTSGSPFWVVCRYDWSDPDEVRWVVEDCSWGGSGEGFVRTTPTTDGGTRLRAHWTYTDATRLRDKVMLPLIGVFPLRLLIARGWVRALDRLADGSS